MNADLGALEKKVDDVAALCRRLRDENRALQERLSGLEEEKQALTQRMNQARLRLEALAEKLPE